MGIEQAFGILALIGIALEVSIIAWRLNGYDE